MNDSQTLVDEPQIDADTLSNPDQSTLEAAPESGDDRGMRVARLVLEDFAVTQLLSRGRALRNTELTGAAEDFSLTRAGLKEGLEGSRLLEAHERDWELGLRVRNKHLARDERARAPLESSLRALLAEIGKPLPAAVIVREVSLMRGTYPETVRDAVQTVLKNNRWAVEVRDNTYLHEQFLLDAGAPREELVVRENGLEADADFVSLRDLQVEAAGDWTQRAIAILHAAGRPISQKLLGFLLYRQEPQSFDAKLLARALGDRAKFYAFVGGYVTTQAMLASVRGELDAWMHQQSGAAALNIDVAQILRQRLAPNQIIAPEAAQLEEVLAFAKGTGGQSFSLATALTDVLELEAEDERFVPLLQGLNDALRRSPDYLSAGIGQFLLREAVPTYVGEIAPELRPIHLSVRDPETNESYDFEMTDDGLEGDAAEFVHSPQWEDVNEEVEVKLPRRASEVPAETRYVLLDHHHRAGTLKLRRMDEEFFAIEGALSRVPMRAIDGGQSESLTVWSSRESGLLYGLGDWFQTRTPRSGGVLIFSRDPQAPVSTPIEVRIGEPDKLMHIEERRAEELDRLRAPAAYLSLFELLQSVMSAQSKGASLGQLWAEVNMVRRTSKRLLCSVLSAYHCYYFKQRGPTQILWHYDAGKMDQGFKRNKRKFVRR